jgi:predicted dehydrogenase
MTRRAKVSRRTFLKCVGATAAFPYIAPGSALGLSGSVAPSNRITMGCIGVGRMGTDDMREFLGFPNVQVLAVCDVDDKRADRARDLVEGRYASAKESGKYKGCDVYGDFRELAARADIDAALICTPDHWHVLPAMECVRSGKDVYLEKPLSYTIREGRALSDCVSRHGRILQVGSQQRSSWEFRFGCELVRNERIGKLRSVKVGLEGDPGNAVQPPMPVPPTFNYDMWLGPAPLVPYTEERCHPQNGYGRPGWLRVSDYSGGMMTGWGAHHNDIAQWGMGVELSGPSKIEGSGEFPREGLWDVHGDFDITYTYASGIPVNCSTKNRNGVLFEGSEGWVFVSRGVIETQPKSLLKTVIGAEEIHLCESGSHKKNFLDSLIARTQPIAPVEVGHRSCSMCLLGNIAMLLRRKLQWDPVAEKFIDDPEADRLLWRPMRAPWSL